LIINEVTGRIEISPQLSLYPYMLLADFQQKHLDDTWKLVRSQNKYTSYERELFDYFSRKLNISIHFYDEVIFIIEVSYFIHGEVETRFREGNYPNSESRRSQYHHELLISELGEPPYKFNWGSITLGYSSIGNFASIVIEYIKK
jgi:hypothetical protein